ALHPTHHLTERQGCGFNDPDHSYKGGRVQLDDGRCDGFRRGSNDDFAHRYYTHAGRTEQVDNSMVTTNMPTIWDRLATAGVSANYYFNDLPFLALWGEKYI